MSFALPEPMRGAIDERVDTRADGTVLAVPRQSATLYASDPRNRLCFPLAVLPETMAALAVRPDGRIFTVSATNKLYEFDAQSPRCAVKP